MVTYNLPYVRGEENIHGEWDPVVHFDIINVAFFGPSIGAVRQALDNPRVGKAVMMDIILEVFNLSQTE